MEKKYKSVEVLEERDYIPTKIKVIYEDGTIKEIFAKKDEFYSEEIDQVLSDFAKQEGYKDSYEFTKKSNKYVKKLSKEEESLEEETYIPVSTKKEAEEVKPNKTNLRRIGAGVLTIIVAMTAGGYIWKNKKSEGQTNNKAKNQFIQMVDYPDDEKNNFTGRLETLDETEKKVQKELEKTIDGETASTKQLDEFLSKQEALAWANVTNVSNYINGQKLTGNYYYTSFKSLYEQDTIEFAAVQYFNVLRNNIIYAAYEDKSIEKTKQAVTAFNQIFVKFVFGDKEFKYDEIAKSYKWEDLSASAQNTILAMGMGILTIEHDFNVTINGEKYNRILTIEEVSKLKEQVYEDILVQQEFYKKNSK